MILLSDFIIADIRTTVFVVLLTLTPLCWTLFPSLSYILRWSISNIRLQILLLLRKNAANSKNTNDDSDDYYKVSGIYIHPVKSMRAISLSESMINQKGLIDDRRFMVVYEVPLPAYKTKWESGDTTHRFLTQRQCPSLATISATITKTKTTKASTKIEKDDGNVLVLEKWSISSSSSTTTTSLIKSNDANYGNDDGGNSDKSSTSTTARIRIPLNHNRQPQQTYLAGIWDDIVIVEDMGDDAAAFVQRSIDADDEFSCNRKIVRLVSQPTTTTNYRYSKQRLRVPPVGRDDRNYIPDYAKTWNGSALGKPTLTDGFPILIASEASLDDVNRKLIASGKDCIPMSRFRPNIVIRGKSLKPFEEDTWKIVLIGEILFGIVKACPRCKQSCTDQTTGQVSPDNEPVKTMKSFRRAKVNQPDGGSVFFAQNAIPLGRMEGRTINVGDVVTVIQRGDPVYID